MTSRVRPRQASSVLDTGLGFLAILLWSTTVALGRSQAEQLGTLTAGALVSLLAGLLGAGRSILTGRLWPALRASSARYLLGCGGTFVLYLASLYLALGLAADRIQVLEVGLINYLWPMLTLLLAIPMFQMRATFWVVLGVALSLGGVWLATTQGQALSWSSFLSNVRQNAPPYLLALVGALTWGLYSNLSRKWGHDGQGEMVPLFMLAAGIILGVARAFSPEQAVWTGPILLQVAFMAVAANVAYISWARAMRKGDIILVAASSNLTPLLSMIVSGLHLRVGVGIELWMGCVLVVAGAALCKLAVREPRAAVE